MRVAIIYNRDLSGVINQFGMQNKEIYNPNTVKRVADALEQGGHNVRIIDGNMQFIESLQGQIKILREKRWKLRSDDYDHFLTFFWKGEYVKAIRVVQNMLKEEKQTLVQRTQKKLRQTLRS